MPDQTVKVTFNPSNSNSWSFDPQTVTMTSAGKIKLQRDSQSPNWSFDSVGGVPSGWSQAQKGNGSEFEVDDTLSPDNQNFTYTVTVSYNGTQYTSPATAGTRAVAGVPPVIQNDGTEPVPKPKA